MVANDAVRRVTRFLKNWGVRLLIKRSRETPPVHSLIGGDALGRSGPT
jgi:hypothetical protein